MPIWENGIYKDSYKSCLIGIDDKTQRNIKLYLNTRVIGPHAFKDTKIKNVIFSPRLQRINDEAFMNTNIINLKLPDSVNSIGAKCFANCKYLKTVDLSNLDIYELPEKCFEGCERLQKVILPKNLKKIKAECFHGCLNLKDIEFPESVQSICFGAFKSTALENIKLPPLMKELQGDVFAETNISEIDCSFITDIKGGVFRNCINLKKIILSDDLEEISLSAFNNTEIYEIELPSKIQNVIFPERKNLNIYTLLYKNIERPYVEEDIRKKAAINGVDFIKEDLDYIINSSTSFKEINERVKRLKEGSR